MFITELFESNEKHASFCFGRMNPPTAGHEQLLNAVAQSSQGGDYYIFTSQSQDAKKNPLDYQSKVRFLKAIYPSMASHIVYDTSLKTIMQVAEWLYNKGYTSVTFVAGSDRLADFEKLINSYNGVEGKNIYYKFDSINFVSSGERDPDSEGIAGISASSAREAAVNGDYESFRNAVNADHLTDKLYNAVRKGMGVEDAELAENTFTNSRLRHMPGSGRGELNSSAHLWKKDDKYGWHVRAPNGSVVFQSTNKNSYQAREEVKAKAEEFNSGITEGWFSRFSPRKAEPNNPTDDSASHSGIRSDNERRQVSRDYYVALEMIKSIEQLPNPTGSTRDLKLMKQRAVDLKKQLDLYDQAVNRKEIKEMFGPMGGDQRNMRGSSSYAPEKSFNGSLTVSYTNFNDYKLASKCNVKVADSKASEKNLTITGPKKNIKQFLMMSGWSSTDLKRWYPELSEDAAGVGVIAKNKKMANDPRYSMSLTKDVRPDTPAKMKKAFRL